MRRPIELLPGRGVSEPEVRAAVDHHGVLAEGLGDGTGLAVRQREKDDVGGVFTLVWQRFPDGWKIVHDHTSAVEAPKTNP